MHVNNLMLEFLILWLPEGANRLFLSLHLRSAGYVLRYAVLFWKFDCLRFTQISNSRSFFPVVSCSLCSSLWSHEHVRSISLIAQVVGLLPDCYRLSDCCWIVIGLLSDCYRIVTGYRIVVGLLSVVGLLRLSMPDFYESEVFWRAPKAINNWYGAVISNRIIK